MKKFAPIIKEVARKRRVAKVFANGAYDSRENFNLLQDYGIEPAIRLKRGSSTLAHGSPLRRQEVLLLNRLEDEGWKRLKEYGKRWMAE